MPSLGGNGRHFHSIKVVSRKPVSRKYNLNIDPSDKEGFGTSAKVELTTSPASKEPPKVTTTPQVIITPSLSVQ